MADYVPEQKVDEVCRNYRNRGRCRYGENCKFQHTEGEPIPVEIKPRGLCFKFQEGVCDYGDRCRFFHGSQEEAEVEAAQRQAAADDKAARKAAALAAGEEWVDEDRPRRRRNRRKKQAVEYDENQEFADALDADGNEICRQFRNKGDCRHGQDCKFVHSGGLPIAGGRRRKAKAKQAGVCFNFRDNGCCEYADECRFLHGDDDNRDLQALKNRKNPGACYKFLDGECERGDACRFSHDPNAPDDRQYDNAPDDRQYDNAPDDRQYDNAPDDRQYDQ